jgi:nifR3 family TIM-barrel protein
MTTDGSLIRPLRLGTLHLRSNLVLAAMHHHSHGAMRRMCRACGAALAHTPMITPEALLHDRVRREAILSPHLADRPLGVQLLPGDPAALSEAVGLVAECGAADLIDLNFGCPSPRTVRTGRGGAMLARPAAAVALVGTALDASALPVTLKLRLGLSDRPADREAARELARSAADAGAVAVTLHARTVVQGYRGRADRTAVARWTAELPVPVLGSGDLHGPEAVLAMLRETGCAGASLARGALGTPWIFRQTLELAATGRYDPATRAERRNGLLKHFALLAERFGEARTLLLMRRLAPHYARGLPQAARIRRRLQTARSGATFRQTAEECFGGG